MTTTIADLSTDTFDQLVLGSDGPVVVDFWAEWCGPCHTLTPVLESIGDEHRDVLRIYKVNADDHPAIANRFGVMGVPTLLVFNDGELVNRLVGSRSKGRLLEELADLLG